VLAQTGTEITPLNSGIRVRRNGGGIEPVDVETQPFPGFPTDLQAQFMALMTAPRHARDPRDDLREPLHACAGTGAARRAHHRSTARPPSSRACRAEGRAGHGDRPARLGLAGHRGLAAEGETVVNRVYHLDRGFERWRPSCRLRRRDRAVALHINGHRDAARAGAETIERSVCHV
jgi:UDP-N-acetylglucosamine 1-carboxyvinyltransferase